MSILKSNNLLKIALIGLSSIIITTLLLATFKTTKSYAINDDKVFSNLIMQAEQWSVNMVDPPDADMGKDNIPESTIQDMHNKKTDLVNKIFTGNYKLIAQDLVDNNFKEELYKKSLGGGVNSVKINSLTVDGNNATANADVSKYIKVKLIKDGKTYSGKAEGTSNYTFYFTQDNGQWKISRISGGDPYPKDSNFTMTPINS